MLCPPRFRCRKVAIGPATIFVRGCYECIAYSVESLLLSRCVEDVYPPKRSKPMDATFIGGCSYPWRGPSMRAEMLIELGRKFCLTYRYKVVSTFEKSLM